MGSFTEIFRKISIIMPGFTRESTEKLFVINARTEIAEQVLSSTGFYRGICVSTIMIWTSVNIAHLNMSSLLIIKDIWTNIFESKISNAINVTLRFQRKQSSDYITLDTKDTFTTA